MHPHHQTRQRRAHFIRDSYIFFGFLLALVIAGIFIYYGRELYRDDTAQTDRLLAQIDRSEKELAAVQAQYAQVQQQEQEAEAQTAQLDQTLQTLERERDAILNLKAKEAMPHAHSVPASGRHVSRKFHPAAGPLFPPDPHRTEWSQFYEDRGMENPAK